MKNKKVFILATINSFVGIPLVKEVHDVFQTKGETCAIQNTFNNFSNFLENSTDQFTIKNYQSGREFNNQTLFQKIIKYLKLSCFLIWCILKNRIKRNEIIIYSTDIYTIYLSYLFKSKHIKIIYHQFEMLEIELLNRLDSFLLSRISKGFGRIDLVIFPETNRMGYFKNILESYNDDQFFILPNTNNNNNNNNRVGGVKNKIKVTHIGAVGVNHNISNYLDAIILLPSDEYEFWFVGLLDDDVLQLIESKKASNIVLTGQIPHEDLKEVYSTTDIGVILYKDISLNHRFCAPNKLYEYWSYGIPVLGDKLPGLDAVFIHKDLGSLVDMSISEDISYTLKEMQYLKEETSLRIDKIFKSTYRLDLYIDGLINKIN